MDRIIEIFLFEGTFKGPLIQPTCNEQGHLQLDDVALSPIKLALNVYIHYLSGQPVRAFHHPHCKKKIFLVSSLNLPSFCLKQLPFVLSQRALLKSFSSSFV